MKPIHTAIVTPEQQEATRVLAAELGITVEDFAQDWRGASTFTDSLSRPEHIELTRIAHSMDITLAHLVRGILRGFLKRKRVQTEQRAAA